MTTSDQPKIQIIDVGNASHGLVDLLRQSLPPDQQDRVRPLDLVATGHSAHMAVNPFGDAVAAAQRYNRKVIHVQQSMADLTAPSSDPAYSRARVRKYLGRHGLRGAALRAEVDRITAGYAASVLKANEFATLALAPGKALDRFNAEAEVAAMGKERVRHPYGWPKKAMTRLMKRMFHGHAKRMYPPIMDEFWLLAGRS